MTARWGCVQLEYILYTQALRRAPHPVTCLKKHTSQLGFLPKVSCARTHSVFSSQIVSGDDCFHRNASVKPYLSAFRCLTRMVRSSSRLPRCGAQRVSCLWAARDSALSIMLRGPSSRSTGHCWCFVEAQISKAYYLLPLEVRDQQKKPRILCLPSRHTKHAPV